MAEINLLGQSVTRNTKELQSYQKNLNNFTPTSPLAYFFGISPSLPIEN